MEDKLYKFLKYYNANPQWVKELLGRIYRSIPLSIRYGKIYTEYTKLLEESQWWSREKLEEYQWCKLEVLLKHAYQNVPYYRRVFDEKGLKPKDIQNWDDFRKVPFLTKQIIRDNLEDLVAKNYSQSRKLYVTTGGSTGMPLSLYYEKGVARSKELAFITALWSRVGYKSGDKLAVLRANLVRGIDNRKFWEYEPIKNRLILSSYHMTDENLPLYIEQIRTFKPKFLHIYPSTLTILAMFMKKNNIQPFQSVKAILASSESMFPLKIKLFEEVFQCQFFFWYGLTELSALAGPCEKSIYYHIFPEYSYVELIDSNGNPVAEENTMGEIVGTTFDNDIMPLIRYKTQDLAVHAKPKCKCGRNYPLLSRIEGRLQEFFVDKNGSLITFIAHDYALWNVRDKINAYQYVQNEPGRVLLNIDAKNKFSISDIDSVKRTFWDFYPSFDIKIKFVEHIPRTERGKFRYLIQKLPVKFGVE